MLSSELDEELSLLEEGAALLRLEEEEEELALLRLEEEELEEGAALLRLEEEELEEGAEELEEASSWFPQPAKANSITAPMRMNLRFIGTSFSFESMPKTMS